MLNASGVEPRQVELLASSQEATPINRTDILIDQYQQFNYNPSKRSKGGDDSFEREYRLAPGTNKYFYNNSNRPTTNSSTTTRVNFTGTNEGERQATFPPFKINFDSDKVPSELAVIKDINKHCKISLSYGRYSSMGNKKIFLLYANSNDQFERLLNKSSWPMSICSCNYKLDIPSKVPASYSLIATGIPAQWDLTDFELDVKKQYPSIIKVERMLVRGGIPIAKVRIDFSSNTDIQKILKNKRLLLDDENTSFPVQQYYPPFKILRCYNCQQYNDHVAANCPRKDNPICFRCGQNHPYNPTCSNKVCCAHCKEEHLTGNPSCRVKIEERNKCKSNMVKSNGYQSIPTKVSPAAWTTTTNRIFTTDSQPLTTVAASTLTSRDNSNLSSSLDISKKLDLILIKIDSLTGEYDNLKTNFINVNQQLKSCQENINLLKIFISEQICPLILEVGEGVMSKKKDVNKKKLGPLISNFNKGLESMTKSTESNSIQLSSSVLKKSSSYDSISEEF
jgi:hypothetical protein